MMKTVDRIRHESRKFDKGYNIRFFNKQDLGYAELAVGKDYSLQEKCTNEIYDIRVLEFDGWEYKARLI